MSADPESVDSKSKRVRRAQAFLSKPSGRRLRCGCKDCTHCGSPYRRRALRAIKHSERGGVKAAFKEAGY